MAVEFSTVLPAAPDVNTGNSSVTVTATDFVDTSLVTVEVAFTVNVYTLEPAADAEASKSGAATHVNTPVAVLIANNASSSEPDKANVESVAAAV